MKPTTPSSPATETAKPKVTKGHLQAPSVLLVGGPGSGKTYAISTLLEQGLTVFVVVTEPVGLDTLLDVVAAKNLPLDNLHYAVITPARAGFEHQLSVAKKVATMSFDSLTKLQPTQGRQHASWIKLLGILSDFVCDRTGESFGPIDSLPADSAVVIDSLSGLNIMAMDLTIGDKPTAHQGEWGVAMGLLERLINTLTSSLQCPLVLIAHIEREQDEQTGGTRLMAGALGRKLAPKLPRFFSEVVMSYREGQNFYWTTTAMNTDLKNRSLPLANKLEPSFKPIIAAHKKRLELVKGT